MIIKLDPAPAPAAGTSNPPPTPPNPVAGAAAVPPPAAAPPTPITPEAQAVLDAAKTAQPPVAAPVIPDKYDLKLPEGSPLDPASVKKAEEFAKANKLTQAQAQELLTRDSVTVADYIKAGQEALKASKGKYIDQLTADPEIGGANLTKNVEMAKRVMDTFASPELKKLLNDTGLGNHPELVKVFAKVGAKMSEDSFIPGGGSSQLTEKSVADKLFAEKKKQ